MIKHKGFRNVVPCGRCNYCLQQKRQDWTVRLLDEYRRASTGYFLTLTYDDDHLPLDQVTGIPTLDKRHVQLFLKRLRQAQLEYSKEQLRYYNVGEYGTEFERPHYHMLIFNLHPKVFDKVFEYWHHGSVYVGDVQFASIHYVTKYVINRVEQGSTCPVMRIIKPREAPFATMSKRPGIGSMYLNDEAMLKWHSTTDQFGPIRNYVMVNGVKSRLPRYYKDQLFTERERQYMAFFAIEKADEAYWKEIDRLSRLERDPLNYYDQRERINEQLVSNKINSQNKF